MKSGVENMWGDWVRLRSRVVGFRSQKELAAVVGCTEDQLSRWVNMELPPRQMRKGFDDRLAYALQTTRQMLFEEWKKTPAEAADRVLFHTDQLPLKEKMSWDPNLQTMLQGMIPYLAPSEAEQELLRIAVIFTDKGPADSRYEMGKKILDRFKLVEHFERTGERLPAPPPSREEEIAKYLKKRRSEPKTPPEPWPN